LKEDSDRLSEIRKREEESYRSNAKGNDNDKVNGRNQTSSTSKSRHENGDSN